MKARPILFSAPMIRALLEGRKTQTRRVVKPQPLPGVPGSIVVPRPAFGGSVAYWFDKDDRGVVSKEKTVACPYGQPGDLLWVRETCRGVKVEPYACRMWTYDADGSLTDRPAAWTGARAAIPSIHMPRWASRLTLRLTDVRVQRIAAIGWDDAVAEGVNPWESPDQNAIDGFHALWDSINAARGFGWDANPWVWALTFEVIHKNVDDVLREAA